MPQNISCLLALALAVGSALVAIPSQAQTASSNRDITESSITDDAAKTSDVNNSSNPNKDKTTDISISQSQPESTTGNTQKPQRVRIPVYSRIGFGLSQ